MQDARLAVRAALGDREERARAAPLERALVEELAADAGFARERRDAFAVCAGGEFVRRQGCELAHEPVGARFRFDATDALRRDGDNLIVSPAAGLRRGDRVIVKTAAGEVLIRRMLRRGAKKLELAPLVHGPAGTAEEALAIEDFAFVHRIVWASQ